MKDNDDVDFNVSTTTVQTPLMKHSEPRSSLFATPSNGRGMDNTSRLPTPTSTTPYSVLPQNAGLTNTNASFPFQVNSSLSSATRVSHMVPTSAMATPNTTMKPLALPFQMSTGVPGGITISLGDKEQAEFLAIQRSMLKTLKWIAGIIIGSLVVSCCIFIAVLVALIVWRDTGTTINNFTEASVPLMSNVGQMLTSAQPHVPVWFDSVDGLTTHIPEWLKAADGFAKSVRNWTDSHSDKMFATMDAFTDDPFALYNLIFSTLDSVHGTIEPVRNNTEVWIATANILFTRVKEVTDLLDEILRQTASVGIDDILFKMKEVVQQVYDAVLMWNEFRGFKQQLAASPHNPP